MKPPGESAWEMFYTEDAGKLNRNGALGTIEKPPFYAAPYQKYGLDVEILPGGAGTPTIPVTWPFLTER